MTTRTTKKAPVNGPKPRSAPKTVPDVYTDLKDKIVRGALAPGAPLIERPLAERLGVSRGSLRSALQRLEHEGFVRSSNAGMYSRAVVAPLTVGDMDEIYTLIALLNGAAARQAAELPKPDRRRIATAMQALNDELATLLHSPAGEFAAVYDIDDQFHRQYIEAASGPRLRALCDAVSSQGERYGRAYASAMGHAAMLRGPASSSPAEHQAIIDAIRAGNPENAERAAVTNWRNAADRLRRIVASAGERGSF